MANTSLPKHASCWIGPLKSGSPISRWTVGYRTHKPTGFCKRGQQEFTSRNFSKSKGRHEAEVSQKDAPMLGLQTFAENVSIVDGPPVRAVGVTFTTRMIIVKLADGSLWVNSPVPVPADMLDRITASGPVRYLVAPTRMHVWRLEEWHGLFPDAELWGPPQIPNKFKRLPFAGILGDAPPQGWADDLDQLVFKGDLFIDEVLFFHEKSRTVILADFVQNRPIAKGKPFLNALFKLAGVAYPHGGVALDIRLSFTNRNLARQSLEKLLSWDFDKLIIAHGICVEKDAKPFVERAFRWLVRSPR
jgi:Domain of unknown function (DUF4336)